MATTYHYHIVLRGVLYIVVSLLDRVGIVLLPFAMGALWDFAVKASKHGVYVQLVHSR